VRKSKKISSAILLVFLITLFGAFSASAADLSDIKGHWAENEIKAMVSQGIVTGYTDNTFKPGNAISRAEFITIINRAFGFEESAEISYTDVKPGDWFAPQIQKARAAGYIAGYEDNTMRPNNKISRQEVAVIIGRILNLDNNAGLTEVDRFSDAASIPSWSRGAVGAVVAAGYMTGYPDGSFKAGNNITRAEAVVVVGRCLVEEIFSQAGTYGPATGSQTIDGNAVISVSGVTLQNMVINGDLTIASTVGEGNFTLKNVTVKGTTYVNGGGADSGILDGFQGQIVVNKHGVRLIATGATSVSTTTLNTFARLEEPATLTGTGFYNLVLTGSIPAGTTIVISGDFNNVVVNAPGVIVKIESGSKVASLEVNQSASITGTGTISTATVNAANVTIAQTPNKTIVAEGLTAMVGGKEVSGTYTKPTGGGGGGGTVAVTGITLSPTTLQLNLGQSSTLIATITPANATNKNITWTSDRPGAVTVNNGVVTAVGKGTATITATTEDGGKTATCVVTVVKEPVDRIPDIVAEMQRIYPYIDNSEKGYIGDARSAIKEVSDAAWDDILSCLLTDEVINHFAAAGKDARDEMVSFTQALGDIYYSTDDDELENTLRDFKTEFKDSFQILFGTGISVDDLYQLLMETKKQFPKVISKTSGYVDDLAFGTDDDLVNTIPEVMKDAIREAIKKNEFSEFRGKLSEIGWTADLLISERVKLSEEVDPDNAAELALGKAVVRSESALIDQDTNESYKAQGEIINLAVGSELRSYRLEIMGKNATGLVDWVVLQDDIEFGTRIDANNGEINHPVANIKDNNGTLEITPNAAGEIVLVAVRGVGGGSVIDDWVLKLHIIATE
jgi:hypothetical protein